MAEERLVDDDYRRLLDLRTGLRRFLRWSEEQARVAGLTPAQHQLLLAVRGLEAGPGPTIGDVADALMLRHHSAVELVQRAEVAGLLTRSTDADDGRVVRLGLSRRGRNALERLAALHLEELKRLGNPLHPLWEGLDGGERARRADH
jgi:DNA-binding MarR family transcriptional regulator